MSDKPKTDWIPVLVTCIVFLFATSMLLYAVSENRKNDNEYFKGRLTALETRITQQDKRIDALEEGLKKINGDLRDMSVLMVQINANVLENSKQIDLILNPPKPVTKKAKPKPAVKPEKPYVPPVQGPRPEPPPPRTGLYAIEGKKPVDQ